MYRDIEGSMACNIKPLKVFDVAVTMHVVVKARSEADALNRIQEMMTCQPDEMSARRIS